MINRTATTGRRGRDSATAAFELVKDSRIGELTARFDIVNHATVLQVTNGELPQDHTGFYFVGGGGGVALPGRHVLQPGLSAMAAIKACGGFTTGALKTNAELTRAGSVAPLVINLAAIEQGSAADPKLMPGDKLWIPASPPDGH